MSDAEDLVIDILSEAARIQRDKVGRPLTPNEVQTVKAADFLRKIAPALTDGVEPEELTPPVKES